MKRFWIGLIGLILISGLVFAQDKSEKSTSYDTNFISAGLGTSGAILGAGFKLRGPGYIGLKTYHRFLFEKWPYESSSFGSHFLSLEIVIGCYITERIYVTMGEGRGRILKWFSKMKDDNSYISMDAGFRLLKNGKNSVWIEIGTKGPYNGNVLHISFTTRLSL